MGQGVGGGCGLFLQTRDKAPISEFAQFFIHKGVFQPMGQTKRLLELGEEMDLVRGVNCSVCSGRVSASDWSGNPHIQKARREMRRDGGQERPICWSCAKAMYGDD